MPSLIPALKKLALHPWIRGIVSAVMLPSLSFMLSIGSCGSEAENATASQPTSVATTAKVMPLGDSITESSQGLSSYRFYLWHLALAHGYRIDLVGSGHGVGNGPPADPDFDGS